MSLSPDPAAESSFLLWLLASLVQWLAVHVLLTSVRLRRRSDARQRPHALLLLMAMLAMGTSLSTAMILGLASQPLPFGLGFDRGQALLLWALGVLSAAAVALALARRPSVARCAAAAFGLSFLCLVIQSGWLLAADFVPGIDWQPEFLAAAGLLMVGGLSAAFVVAFSERAAVSRRRWLWRLAASGLAALSLNGGQEIVITGASLPAQTASGHARELSAATLALGLGGVVPLALVALTLDLAFGHRRQPAASDPDPLPSPPRRRKRRHRERHL